MVASNRPYREEFPEHSAQRETTIMLFERDMSFDRHADQMREAYEDYMRDVGDRKNPSLKTFELLYEQDL